MSPLLTPYKADGSLNPFPFNSVDPNPFLTYDVYDYDRHNYFFANTYAEANIPFVKGLSYRVNFGNNSRQDKRYNASKYAGGLTGQAYKVNENYYDYTLDNILTYNRSFKDISFIEQPKLRGGYGVSGNQTTRYSSLDMVSTQAAYVFGDGGSTVFGQSINTLSNPDSCRQVTLF